MVAGCLGFDHRRTLAVPQLAYVEVLLDAVGARATFPAQEDVARGLHQPLSADHSLALRSERRAVDVELNTE